MNKEEKVIREILRYFEGATYRVIHNGCWINRVDVICYLKTKLDNLKYKKKRPTKILVRLKYNRKKEDETLTTKKKEQ